MNDKFLSISETELGKGSTISSKILDTETDVYKSMANEMFRCIYSNNLKNKHTVFILPLGPVGQYAYFTDMVNKERLSLKDLYVINMDEYLDDDLKMLDIDNPLSFRRQMDDLFYNRIEPVLNVPYENRYFPEPGLESVIPSLIDKLGGVDICFGGVGINGHVAFNEPPEDDEDISDDEFTKLSVRVLPVSRETRTINSVTAAGGYISIMPKWCITIGMKEILASRKVRLYLIRDWQRGIVRQILHGEVTKKVPASYLLTHPDALLVMSKTVARIPMVV